VGSGTRPRLDRGQLGIAVFGSASERDSGDRHTRGPLLQWATPQFEVRSSRPIPTGIDGEAVVLDAPLRFTSRPAALTVRIAPQHPGASPSAGLPDTPWNALHQLTHLATGHTQ
jgi:hypothetical protein